jgi:hypothetical protein
VKRISYLANKDETGFLSIPRFTLHERRFTLTAIAVEAFMEIDNLEEAAGHRYFSLWIGAASASLALNRERCLGRSSATPPC